MSFVNKMIPSPEYQTDNRWSNHQVRVGFDYSRDVFQEAREYNDRIGYRGPFLLAMDGTIFHTLICIMLHAICAYFF